MRRHYIPILMFIAYGYVIAMPLMLLTGTFSGTINLYVRVAEVGFLLMVLLLSLPSMRTSNTALLPLIFFFLIYAIRLTNDVLAKGILMIYQSPTYVLGYFFGLTLLPMIAVALLYRPQDSRTVFRYLLTFLIIANVLLFLYAMFHGDFSRGGLFSGRIQEKGELEGSAVLGPIWLGMTGAMLASMLFGIFSSKQGLSKVELAGGAALLGLCATNILFSASRGPVLALVLAIMMFLFNPGTKFQGVKKVVSRGKAWMSALGVVAIAIVLIASSDGNVFLVERFVSLFADRLASGGSGGFEERDIVFAVAWRDFLSAPVFGSSYVVSYANSSPHNVILEALIATGIAGSLILFFALFRAFMGIRRLIGGQHGVEGVSLALATICSLVVGLTSSSIGQSPALWILVALVTVMGRKETSPKRYMAARTGMLR